MFVPCGSVEAYQTAPGWNEFTNIEDICSPRTVTVVANPDEYGTVSGAGVFDFGVMCTVSAVPNEGYCFYYWTEEGNVVSTDADYSFVVSTDHDFEAVFGLPITITMSANMVEGGTVSGDGVYAYGDICTITAVSNEGYSFLDWNANGETVSYLAAYSFTVTESVEFVADFAPHGGALIGGAESTSPYLPSHSQYKYSLSQQIYTSAELGGSRVINSIAFFNTGVTKTRSFDIYMVHTEKETFAINTDWIPVVESDLVYSGSVTMTQGEWNNIIFDVPFVYDGNANLAIIIDDNTGDYSGYPWMDYLDCRVFNTSSIQAIYTNGYGVNYDPSLPVSYEGSLESVKNQIILNMEAETNQVASFTQGVTWWSPTVFAPDLLGQLEQLLGGDGAMINSQYSGFAQYENGAWSGMLDAVLPGQMYKIQTTAPCEVTLNGSIINPYDCPITIQPNWNWIGYPCPVQRTVTSAFSNLIPEDGDILRGQSAYAVYYAGYGWFPPNMTLTPGAGYLYQSNASESKTFVIGNSRENIPQRVGLHWKSRMDGCSSVAYVTAALVYDGEELRGDSVELGAFVNGICRGCARLTYFEPTGRWYVMLAITANEGEQIDFIIIDESRGWVDVMSSDHLEFKGHAMTGTLDNPCIIQFGAKNSSH